MFSWIIRVGPLRSLESSRGGRRRQEGRKGGMAAKAEVGVTQGQYPQNGRPLGAGKGKDVASLLEHPEEICSRDPVRVLTSRL